MILTQQKQKPTSLSTYKTPRMMVKRENYLFAENTSDSFLLLPVFKKRKKWEKKESFTNTDGCRIFPEKNTEKKSTTTQEKPRSTTKQEKKLQPKDNPGIYFFCTIFSVKKFPLLSANRELSSDWLLLEDRQQRSIAIVRICEQKDQDVVVVVVLLLLVVVRRNSQQP